MKKQKEYLFQGMDRIFRSTDELGFWDEKKSRIHARLVFSKDWDWEVGSDETDRYGLFTITMILQAKVHHDLDITIYESKIIAYLNYIKEQISGFKKSDITYGAFNALVLGQILFEDKGQNFKNELFSTFQFLKNSMPSIRNNEDSLALIGLSQYYNQVHKDKEVFNYIKNLVVSILKSQNDNGFFLTSDTRAVYHQRTMYTLWGLAFASTVTHKPEIKLAIERSIQYVWNYRRDGKDNAFLWHPLIFIIKTKYDIPVPVVSPKSVNYLFECHQTFFANAVNFYQYFYQTSKFSDYRQLALEWIFGDNRIKKNLVSISKLNIPTRIMTRKGKLFLKNNNFKGSYEIGSYIFSLSVNMD